MATVSPRTDYGDPAAELAALQSSCGLVDRSHHAPLIADGPDLLDLLNRMSTKAVAGLQSLEAAETVLTTHKGRIVARLWVHALGEPGVLLICGPTGSRPVVDHLRRFTFAERTGLDEARTELSLLALSGPRAGEALELAGLPRPPARGTAAADEHPDVFVLGHDGQTDDGFAVLVGARESGAARTRLLAAVEAVGGRAAGERAAEIARVMRGVPVAGHELTEDHNPLEAGLWEAVDFDKGCYVGQEVVARLRTYDKVSRTIRVFRSAPDQAIPAIGDALYHGERRCGKVTSLVELPAGTGVAGLVYVKRDVAEDGTELRAGSSEGPRIVLREPPLRTS